MGYDKEIAVLRERIDAIDGKFLALLEDRLNLVKEVGALKQRFGKEVLDLGRERRVIERALSNMRDKSNEQYVKDFFQALMDISKNSEKHIEAPVKAQPAETQIRVGYLGVEGSFSHAAAELSFPRSTLKNHDTFEGIFESLKEGDIDRAMLPAENTETGSITAVVDLLARHGFFIVAEKLLPVSQSLLGIRGASVEDIKVVYSHPEPFGQCSEFLLSQPGMETRPALSTAQAAMTVAQKGDKAVGAIASRRAAEIYGLGVLAENIQNSDSNCTRFVVVAKQPYKGPGCDKTSIVFTVEHKPGSLCEMLEIMRDGGINILKLESRPMKGRPFEYLFHLDFEGNIRNENVAGTIEKFKAAAADYIFLGCYRRDRLEAR